MSDHSESESTESPQDTAPSAECAEALARRSFLTKFCIAMSGLIGLVMAMPGIGFILSPAFRKDKHSWRRIGKKDDYELGKTVSVDFEDARETKWAGVTAQTGAWLRRVSDEEFIAFSINCRHLGCPVNWVADAKLFMCPCHGGVYYEDGEVAAGPPPSPLARYQVRVQEGYVEIETSEIPLTTNDQV